MASKKTVTPDNLAALGVERLAAILVELADGDAEVKRRLRLELAAQAGGDSIAAEIGKRISALRSARSFVDWQKRRDFVRDLVHHTEADKRRLEIVADKSQHVQHGSLLPIGAGEDIVHFVDDENLDLGGPEQV
jgi:hypothetical protein